MKLAIGVFCAVLSLGAVVPYAVAVSGAAATSGAKPRVSSWTVWTMESIVDLAVTLAGGQRTGAPLLAAYVAANAIGLTAAIRSGGIRDLSRLDFVCGGAGLAGIAVWSTLDAPQVTVVIQIAASATASLPTFLNALAGREPQMPWLLWAIGADVNLLALDSSSLQSAGLLVYFAFLCTAMWLACAVSRRRARGTSA